MSKPLVAKLADQAHTFIFELLAELKTEQANDARLDKLQCPAASCPQALRTDGNELTRRRTLSDLTAAR